MARNVEVKARLRDVANAFAVASRLSGSAPQRIEQRDVFFSCGSGRLKLRSFGGEHGELIHYQRPDTGGARTSDYVLIPTDAATQLGEALRRALGETGVVEKTRWLYLVGQTRIHIDEVCKLGAFLELEVVLRPEQDEAEGRAIANQMLAEFRIPAEDLVPCAYVDLLNHAEPELTNSTRRAGGTE